MNASSPLHDALEWWAYRGAFERLMIITGMSQSTVYGVLGDGGQFAANLTRNGKMLAFKE